MAEYNVVAECSVCGAKLTIIQTLYIDEEDDCCPECGEDALIWLLGDDEKDEEDVENCGSA